MWGLLKPLMMLMIQMNRQQTPSKMGVDVSWEQTRQDLMLSFWLWEPLQLFDLGDADEHFGVVMRCHKSLDCQVHQIVL